MKNPFDQQSPIEGIKHIIAVGSGKGGVGKSIISVNLTMTLKKKTESWSFPDFDTIQNIFITLNVVSKSGKKIKRKLLA